MKRFAILFFALLFVAGCGSGHVQLGGTVTFDDGTPLTTGAVIFATETFMASGRIDPQGKFLMGSLNVRDGLPTGTYRVYISGATEENPRADGGMWSLVDLRYGCFTSTPLTCDVPAPKNTFDIVVPRNPTPKP